MAKSTEGRKWLGAYVSEDLHRRFKTFAKANSVTMSALLSRLLQEFLSWHQGRSLVPLFHAPVADWRESFLVEFYTYENPFPWLVDMDYRAIRTDRYKYIHWMQHPDENELYDLVDDPYEMENRIDDPRLAGVRAWLRGKLADAAVGALGLRERAPRR